MDNMKVFKYILPEPNDYFILRLPKDAQILTIQMQRNTPCLWALVDPDMPLEDRKFRWAGTGHLIKEFSHEIKYINTFQMLNGDLVFHLFEIIA